MDAIEKLASLLADAEKLEVGQQTKLAKHCEVTPGMVYQWLNRIRPISSKHAIPIELFFGGALTRYEIRPDVFGPAPQEERAA